jgi:hypothetical protein
MWGAVMVTVSPAPLIEHFLGFLLEAFLWLHSFRFLQTHEEDTRVGTPFYR